MADLVTHIAIAHIIKRSSRWPTHPLLFALGTALPDAMGRGPAILTSALENNTGIVIAPFFAIGADIFHMPLPLVMMSLLIALLFPIHIRATLFRNLVAGGLLHIAVDLPQEHIEGGYRLLFPFSMAPFELGWIGTETSLPFAPFLAALALGVEWRFRRYSSQNPTTGGL